MYVYRLTDVSEGQSDGMVESEGPMDLMADKRKDLQPVFHNFFEWLQMHRQIDTSADM